VQCDHKNDDAVKAFFEKMAREQNGRMDVLVNNVFSAFELITSNVGVPFWELPDSAYDDLNAVGLRNHYMCSVLAARLMVPRKTGLIVNVSSSGGLMPMFNPPYGIGKEGSDRMAADCALELQKHNVAFISLWPLIVHTEGSKFVMGDPIISAKMAEMSGVSEAIVKANYQYGESVEYAGKCVVYLANDKDVMKQSGKIHITGDLGDYYGFRDVGGRKPLNIRRVNCLLRFLPTWASWTANLVPDFVKIPSWIISFAGHKLN